ncbi:MAG: DNA gyrase inhibitor YacG [Leptospirillia bacterium]
MRIPCPICRQVSTWEENKHRPFCSKRCRMIDLGVWASEGYRIAGEPAGSPDDEPLEESPE